MYSQHADTCVQQHTESTTPWTQLPGLPTGVSNIKLRNSLQLPNVFTCFLPWGFLASWGNHIPAAARSPPLLTHHQCSDPAFLCPLVPFGSLSQSFPDLCVSAPERYTSFWPLPIPPREVAVFAICGQSDHPDVQICSGHISASELWMAIISRRKMT